jgi:hypothetical protein
MSMISGKIKENGKSEPKTRGSPNGKCRFQEAGLPFALLSGLLHELKCTETLISFSRLALTPMKRHTKANARHASKSIGNSKAKSNNSDPTSLDPTIQELGSDDKKEATPGHGETVLPVGEIKLSATEDGRQSTRGTENLEKIARSPEAGNQKSSAEEEAGAEDMAVEGPGAVETEETRGEAKNGGGGDALVDLRPSTHSPSAATATQAAKEEEEKKRDCQKMKDNETDKTIEV